MMKIKALFEDGEPITLEKLLSKSGVENVEKYLKANSIDKGKDYVSMKEAKELFEGYVNG